MIEDHQVMTVIVTIVEDPDTIPMSVRHLTRKETNHQEEDIEEMNHLTRREGVEMIVMNEDLHGEARIRKGKTNHPRATQEEDIKLMLVNGYHSERSYHSNSEYTQDEGVAGLALV